ncbi:MAG: Rrf2 family transcriptional regulator [Cytophagales bacterium]|jgi:Rrf2 family protein|nr:Rrf2 family transcriptional regulator [Cytophagales bacterium]
MLSKTCGYALRGILYVALKNEEAKTVGIKEMAEALEVPQPFLSKIMQELVRRDILNSVKGPNGGFFVNERTLQTPVIKVVEAVDGLGAFQKCALGLSKCSGDQPCPLHYQIKAYRDALFDTLCKQCIADLKDDLLVGKVFVKN